MDQATNTAPKAKAEVTKVKLTDGREVEFVGKRKLLKDTIIDESKIQVDGSSVIIGAGAIAVRMDFRNGETRTYPIPLALFAKSAGHGMEQKLGDETAGEEDPDDMVLSIDALTDRLDKNEWRTTREPGNSMSGTSVLLKALVELSGKTVEQVKGFLKDKTQAEKAALRNSAKLRPIVQRIEDEKAAKSSKVDVDQLFGELA